MSLLRYVQANSEGRRMLHIYTWNVPLYTGSHSTHDGGVIISFLYERRKLQIKRIILVLQSWSRFTGDSSKPNSSSVISYKRDFCVSDIASHNTSEL